MDIWVASVSQLLYTVLQWTLGARVFFGHGFPRLWPSSGAAGSYGSFHGLPRWLIIEKLPAVKETWIWSLGREDPLEEVMADHSSVLAWRLPWTEEPDGLQPTGLHRVRHDWSDCAAAAWQFYSWFFRGIFTLFSTLIVSLCIPTSSVRALPFLRTHSSIYCL